MLATGGSAVMALEGLAELGARQVRLLSIVTAPISSGQVEVSETIFQEASGAQAEPLAPAS